MSNDREGPPNIEGMFSLKVDNLTYRTTVDDLKYEFEKYGDVGDVYIPRDRNRGGGSRGFAFVRYYEERDAETAIKELDGRHLDGRQIRVQLAKYGRPSNSGNKRNYDRRSGGSNRGSSRRRRSYSRSRSRSFSPKRRSRSRDRGRGRDRDYDRERRDSRNYDD